MNFLFKFASRGRPEFFKNTLTEHLKYLSNKNKYKFIFSFDNDDYTMKNDEIIYFIKNLNINYELFYGDNKTKIQAYNANLENQDFDVLILLQDDMLPILQDYDELICEIMKTNSNGLDTTIHFNTSRWANLLDTWCIMGKKYYDRFNYIYHPSYKSISCDNEYTEVAKILKKSIFSEKCPFIHNPIVDKTTIKNDCFNIDDDQTFHKRKLINFDIKLC